MERYKMWIGNKWVDAASRKTFRTVNPATEEEIGEVPLAGKEDVDKAVKAAANAFPAWSKLLQGERASLILKLAAVIKERANELIDLEVREHGTPVQMARGFAAACVDQTQYFASISRALMGEVLPQCFPNMLVYLQRVPLGVCGLITPWNVPLMMTVAMVTPALAAGNTVVLKPASVNSMIALKFAQICEQVGFPEGVFNVVTGPGGSVGEALASHPLVDLVRFTGSSETGKQIMTVASPTVKKCVMELGGNNPVIVLDDADVVAAATQHAQRHFGNSAQNCSTPGRYYVHEKVYDQFVEVFAETVKKIVVGDPSDEKTMMGPMANKQQFEKVQHYIQTARDEGGRIVAGGGRPTKAPFDKKGYFLMPTVVADVTHTMTIAKEEIFGPACCILKFSDKDDIVALANDSEYGLCAVVWTKDAMKPLKYVNALHADSVFVNSPRVMASEFPWGGNVKQSGVGKDGSLCGMEELTDLKMVCIAHS